MSLPSTPDLRRDPTAGQSVSQPQHAAWLDALDEPTRAVLGEALAGALQLEPADARQLCREAALYLRGLRAHSACPVAGGAFRHLCRNPEPAMAYAEEMLRDHGLVDPSEIDPAAWARIQQIGRKLAAAEIRVRLADAGGAL